jgi:hypothetical protein
MPTAGVGVPVPGCPSCRDHARRRAGGRRIPAADDGRGGAARGRCLGGAWPPAHQASPSGSRERQQRWRTPAVGAVPGRRPDPSSGGKRLLPAAGLMRCHQHDPRGDELVRAKLRRRTGAHGDAGARRRRRAVAALSHGSSIDFGRGLGHGRPPVRASRRAGTATGDMQAVAILADAARARLRAILQRSSGRRPRRHRRRLPERCTLKTAACSAAALRAPASRSCQLKDRVRAGRFAEALVGPQIADDASTATATRHHRQSRSAPTRWTAGHAAAADGRPP